MIVNQGVEQLVYIFTPLSVVNKHKHTLKPVSTSYSLRNIFNTCHYSCFISAFSTQTASSSAQKGILRGNHLMRFTVLIRFSFSSYKKPQSLTAVTAFFFLTMI